MTALGAGVHSGVPQRALRATGGAEETRTPDFLLAKEALYQLSYGPESGYAAFGAKRSASGRRVEASAADLSESCSASGRFWTRTRDLCLIRAVL
jgi:hypothetical protein